MREELSEKYNKQFKDYEAWALGLKQPWLYENLAIGYNLCAMLENEYVDISDGVLKVLADKGLSGVVAEVLDYMSEKDDYNLDYITIDLLEERYGRE